MAEFAASDLAVIIPTRNRWAILARTLHGLTRQSVAGFEVVVVVDGVDQSPPDSFRNGLGVRTIVKEHGGPGAARNHGVAHTDRRLVLLLGDDMVPTRLLIERHLDAHNRDRSSSTAVLGLSEWHPDVASSRVHRWLDWSSTQFDYDNVTTDDAGWGRFYSSNVSLKRAFYLDAGGFDEAFTYYYEDLDFAWRLHEKGLKLLYEPEARTQHLHAITWPDVVRRFQGIARGEFLMHHKHAWFAPFFRQRVLDASAAPPRSPLWPLAADKAPERLRARVRGRANTRYHQLLAPYFLDAWEGARDLEELQAYAGDRYDQRQLIDHIGGVARELEEMGDEDAFYRTSESYLYDLTAFAMSGTKVPYRNVLKRLVPDHAHLLDWGCGIGSDGLRLLGEGYRVDFADFDNPSTRYLRWRLEHRDLTAKVFDIDTNDIPGGYDAGYSFDVIEHVDDPFAFLETLERRATIVMVNLLEPEPGELHPHHRPLPITRILDHANAKGLVWYRRYYGRSHLVAYRGKGAGSGVTDRIRSEVHRRLGPRLPTARDGA